MLLRTFFGKIGPIKHLHVVFDLREMNDALAPDIYSEFRIKMEKHVKTYCSRRCTSNKLSGVPEDIHSSKLT